MYSFPNLEPVCCSMSDSNCCFLTCIQVFRRQVRWSGILISWRIFQFVIIHTVEVLVLSEAEVDVFLEFSCFFDDPMDDGNLISCSSAFPKYSLYIWEFLVHVLLKPNFENFEDYFVSMWRRQWHPTPVLLPGKIPWMEEPGGLQSMGSLSIGHNWATSLSLFTFMLGEENGNPLQCSCLENPRDGGAWWAAVYGVSQSQTRLKWLSTLNKYKGLYQSALQVSDSTFVCFLSADWEHRLLGPAQMHRCQSSRFSNIFSSIRSSFNAMVLF